MSESFASYFSSLISSWITGLKKKPAEEKSVLPYNGLDGVSTNGHARQDSESDNNAFERLQRTVDGTVRDLESCKAQLSLVEKERDELRATSEESEKEQKVIERAVEKKGEELKLLIERVHMLEDQLRNCEGDLRRAREEAETYKSAAAESQKAHEALDDQHGQTIALLDRRTEELKIAQAFLSTADALSEKDIIRKIQELNSEIQQVAALIANNFKFEANKSDSSRQTESAREWASHALGKTMANLLRSSDDATIVQVALQGCLTMYSHWIIRAWHFGLSKESEVIADIYDDIYYHMRETEQPAVARRWRALTRKHMQGVIHGETDVAANLVPPIADRVMDILLVSGCKSTLKQLNEAIKQRSVDRLGGVVKLALALNRIIGQEVISNDWEVTWVSSEETYDPSWMEDIDTEQSGKKSEDEEAVKVLSTTELGVSKMEKVSSNDVVEEWRDTPLLKPRVVLESMVEWDGTKA